MISMSLIKNIKFIDKGLGKLLLEVLPPTRTLEKKSLKKIHRILVIRPGGMGDALLLLPSLKKVYHSGRVTIDVLCEPRNQTVFQACPFLNNIYSYQHPMSFLSVFKNKYDAIIDTEQSHFLSAVTARFVRSKIRAGFDTFNRGKFFTHTVGYQSGYEAENFWRLFAAIFNFNESFDFDFPYLKGSAAKQTLYMDKKNKICLFPGATTIQRHWPEQRWADVCDWIAQKGYTPVLIGGRMENQNCNSIAAYCKTDKVLNLCSQLSIDQTVHLFTKAQALISTDSGILHLGVICDIPTVSVFGPSSPGKWGPKGEKDRIICKEMPCAPCAKFGTIPACKNKNICMTGISVADVIVKLKQIIAIV